MTSSTTSHPSYTAFDGDRRVARGSLASVLRAVKAPNGPEDAVEVRIYDDDTGVYVPICSRKPRPYGRARTKRHGAPVARSWVWSPAR